MKIEIRKATEYDIKDIKILLSYFFLDTEKVEKNIPEFIVAVIDKKVVGCACLDKENVLELRSIAVKPAFRNRGMGSELIRVILSRASDLSDTIYLRTSSPVFFEKKGFIRLEDREKKVLWEDCARCDKFDICRQSAMKQVIK